MGRSGGQASDSPQLHAPRHALMIVGLLNPGAMGASVGAALRSEGVDVVWASDGRSQATRSRAEQAGLRDVGAIDPLVQESDIVLSICPPDAAVDVAREVVRAGFAGTYVDANAVAPTTVEGIASVVVGGGAMFLAG